MNTSFFSFNTMSSLQTVKLSVGVIFTFLGMMCLRLMQEAGNVGQAIIFLQLFAVFLLVTGSYILSTLINSLDDSFLFSFIKRMEPNNRFSSVSWLLVMLVVFFISLLGFIFSQTTFQSGISSLGIASTFPLLMIFYKYHSRIRTYRKFSQQLIDNGIEHDSQAGTDDSEA